MTAKTTHSTSPFEFHGVNFSKKTDSQWMGDCPFCEKANHFYVNPTEGDKQWCWDCKSGDCGLRGNLYTFLNKLHEKWLDATTPEAYEMLSEVRGGIPPLAFKRASLVFDFDQACWLLPHFNVKGSVINLKKWYPHSQANGYGKPHLIGTPGCPQQLYGLESLESSGPIYLCEGEWDVIALRWLLTKVSSKDPTLVPRNFSILGVPGAAVFKQHWDDHFENRPSILIYDHDKAGRDGLERAFKRISHRTKNILYLSWPEDTTDKYDLRDFICDRLKENKPPTAIYREFVELLSGDRSEYSEVSDIITPSSSVERIPVADFKEVVDSFKSCMHVDSNFVDALTIATASVISVRIPGDPIWMFIVGPASSGKTTLVESFLGSPEYCEGVSKLSATALISGFRGNSDCSFLPKLNGKALIIKDYTAIKKMPSSVQEELYGLLRDIYDGHCKIPYGNNTIRDYSNIRFSSVAAVTDIIHGDNRATLGERFLKTELLGDDFDPNKQIRAAIEGTTHKQERMKFLQGVMLSFLDKKVDPTNLPLVPQWAKDRLVGLSQVVGHLRGQVDREQGILKYRPRAEVGARIASQLIRLGLSISYVFTKPEVDERTYFLMEKVALDTAIGFNLEIVTLLAKLEAGISTIRDISDKLQLSKSTIERHLNNMQELRIVTSRRRVNGKRGHPLYDWQLHPLFQDNWDLAGLYRRKPITD